MAKTFTNESKQIDDTLQFNLNKCHSKKSRFI